MTLHGRIGRVCFSLFQWTSSWSLLVGFLALVWLLRMSHKFSTGLRSGLSSYSISLMLVCFIHSLSCWNSQLCPSSHQLAVDWCWCSFRFVLQIDPSSTWGGIFSQQVRGVSPRNCHNGKHSTVTDNPVGSWLPLLSPPQTLTHHSHTGDGVCGKVWWCRWFQGSARGDWLTQLVK